LLNKSFINITNYEERLLNYIDDELSSDERKAVERSAAKYPTIQKELALLQKTKLQPEADIIFPAKSTLYRREEKVRVISMTWFRVAVAAAIILIAGFVTLRLVTTGKSGQNIDVANKTNPKNSNPVIDPKPDQIPGSQPSDIVIKNEKAVPVQPTIEKKNQKPIIDNKTDNAVVIYKPGNKNNLPKERENIRQNDQNIPTNEIIANADLPDLKKDNSRAQKNNSDAITTSFDNSDVTLQSKPTLHIQGPPEKEKVGLKEFLRKTTRVFERRTKIQATTEDNKLLVGAFAVSLK